MSFRMENSSLNFNHISLYHNNINHKKLNNKKIENYSIEQNELKSLKVSDIPLRAYQAQIGINFGVKGITKNDFGPFDKHLVSLYIPEDILEKANSVEQVQAFLGSSIEGIFLDKKERKNFLHNFVKGKEIQVISEKTEQIIDEWANYLLNNDMPGVTNLTKVYILFSVIAASLLNNKIAPVEQKAIIPALAAVSKVENFIDKEIFVEEYNKAYKEKVGENVAPDDLGPFDKNLVKAFIPEELLGKFHSAEGMQKAAEYVIRDLYLAEKPTKKPLSIFDELFSSPSEDVTAGRADNTQKVEEPMAMTEQWAHYLLDVDIPGVTNMTKLHVLSYIDALSLAGLKLAPIDEQALIKALSVMSKKQNFAAPVIFKEEYNNAYQQKILQDYGITDREYTGWVTIPSPKDDPENAAKNLKNVRGLFFENTSNMIAPDDLPMSYPGTFNVYVDGGKPVVGLVRFGDSILSLHSVTNGEKNKIEYFDEIKKFANENNYSFETEEDENVLQDKAEKLKNFKQFFPDINKPIFLEDLFDYCGFNPRVADDEKVLLGEYRPGILSEKYGKLIKFSDLGINEKLLFEKVNFVDGNVDLLDSSLTSTLDLEYVGGNLYLGKNMLNLGDKLKFINGNIDFSNAPKIEDTANLQVVKGSANFENSSVVSLGNIQFIGGDCLLGNSSVSSTGKLVFCGGSIFVEQSQLKDIDELTCVEGGIVFLNDVIVPSEIINKLNAKGIKYCTIKEYNNRK